MILYEKFRWLLSPLIFISVALIIKYSKNEKQFGLLLKYKKYWWLFLVAGFISFFLEIARLLMR
jgi:hypothetical protein